MDILTTQVTELLTAQLGRAPTAAEVANGIKSPWSLALIHNTLQPGNSVFSISPGDSIQDALDKLGANGGGTLYLDPGQYDLTADITIPDGTNILGAGPETVLDFGGLAFGLKAQGTLLYDTGTIAITDGSTTVTGSGTSWDSSLEGQTLWVDGSSFEVVSVDSSTQITIDASFYGQDISGESYVIFSPVSNIELTNLTIQNSSATALTMEYIGGQVILDFVNIYSCAAGIDFNYVIFATLNFNIVGMTDGHGVSITNLSAITFEDCTAVGIVNGDALYIDNVSNSAIHNVEFSDASGNGITISNSANIGFENMTVARSTGNGIELSSSSEIMLNQAQIEGNGGDGIKFTASNESCTFSQNMIFDNTGYGVNIADSTTSDTILSTNQLGSNTSGAVNDSGTATLIRSNIGVVDN